MPEPMLITSLPSSPNRNRRRQVGDDVVAIAAVDLVGRSRRRRRSFAAVAQKGIDAQPPIRVSRSSERLERPFGTVVLQEMVVVVNRAQACANEQSLMSKSGLPLVGCAICTDLTTSRVGWACRTAGLASGPGRLSPGRCYLRRWRKSCCFELVQQVHALGFSR
jgi:hypothetical protein